MCGGCSLKVSTSHRRVPPRWFCEEQIVGLTKPPNHVCLYPMTERISADKRGCIWLISLSTLMVCLTFQHLRLLVFFLSLPPLSPPCAPCGVSLAFPPYSRTAHLTEPDTEICAANSLHSHGSVWCHNWHAIDLCLLLQRSEWLMSQASCHNKPCPGFLPLGCSPHSFLSSAICCG